jgi:hypothetical protein
MNPWDKDPDVGQTQPWDRDPEVGKTPPPSPVSASPSMINSPTMGAGARGAASPPTGAAGASQASDPVKQYGFLWPVMQSRDAFNSNVSQISGAIKEAVKHPGFKTGTQATLQAIGIPWNTTVGPLISGLAAAPVERGMKQAGIPGSQFVDPVMQVAGAIATGNATPANALIGKAANTPFGRNILGIADTYDAKIAAGRSASILSGELAGLEGKAEAKFLRLRNGFKDVIPPDYQQMAPEIAHSFEDPSHVANLSPAAKTFKETYLDPIAQSTTQMGKALQSLTGQRVAWIENYYPRHTAGDTRQAGWIGPTESRVQTGRKALQTYPQEFQERSAGMITNRATGERYAYSADREKGDNLIWNQQHVMGRGEIENGVFKDSAGGLWDIDPGTMRDIEQHTPITYEKNPVADISQAHYDVFNALAAAQAIERLKTTPEFMAQVRRPNQAHTAPEGWQKADNFNLGTHQLDGHMISPRLQEVFSDFTRNINPNDPNGLRKLNRVMIQSLFLNPVAHIMNVAWHGWVEKGLVHPGTAIGAAAGAALGGPTGMAAGALAGSFLRPTELSALVKATRAVGTQNADYMRYLGDGAGLMWAGRQTRDLYNQMVKLTSNDHSLAQALGFPNPVSMTKALYGASGNVMWFANDIIMMQGYLAKEASLMKAAGVTSEDPAIQRQAMEEVEKHIPNYRIPTRIGPEVLDVVPGGAQMRRNMAQVMSSGAMRFGRYDYGRLASYMNMFKDAFTHTYGAATGGGMKDVKAAGQAYNQLAALAFGSMILYPALLDRTAQAITGNKNASYQRYGPFTVPTLLYDYMQGNKGWEGMAASMFPLSPAATLGAEAIFNKNLFTSQSLNLPQGAFNWLASQFTPLADMQKIQNGKMPPQQYLLSQLGVKSPTQAQVDSVAKWMHKEQTAHQKWLKAHGWEQ